MKRRKGPLGRYGNLPWHRTSPRERFPRVLPLILGLALIATATAQPPPPVTSQTFRTWGNETLARIDADFWLPPRRLYVGEGHLNAPPSSGPAFMWDCGVQLSALAAAARLDPIRYRDRLRDYIDGMNVYWTNANNLGGYDVQPGPKPNDRYYDDNAWIVLALAEAFEVTHDPRDLDRAEATQKFVLSGEDKLLGGGIYWHEPKRETKNTCVNGPAIVGAVRLYQLTHKPEYLADARRLYQWTCAHLRAEDGLFWDNVKVADGKVDQAFYSYNTGLMIRAASLLHAATGENAYLEDAKRTARAAEARWVDPQTGAMRDTGKFAHLLLEGFLALCNEDHDAHWLDLEHKVLLFVHDRLRDANGHYVGNWNHPPDRPLQKFSLIDQGSAARAFMVGAKQP